MHDRRAAGAVSAHAIGCAGASSEPGARRLADPGMDPEMQRFPCHLTVELPAIVSFLLDPDLNA